MIEGSVAIAEEDVMPLIAIWPGFNRITDEIKQIISDAVGLCIRKQRILRFLHKRH